MPAWFAPIIYFVFIISLFVFAVVVLFYLIFFVRDASASVLPSHAARA